MKIYINFKLCCDKNDEDWLFSVHSPSNDGNVLAPIFKKVKKEERQKKIKQSFRLYCLFFQVSVDKIYFLINLQEKFTSQFFRLGTLPILR